MVADLVCQIPHQPDRPILDCTASLTMPPDVKQRALSALWRLIMTLGMFGVGYILWAAQVSTIPAVVVPSSWFLYCHMLLFPASSPAAAFFQFFDGLKDFEIKLLVFTVALALLFYLCRGDPFGLFYVVVSGISHFCITQVAIHRAAMEPATLSLCEEPQLGAAAAEAEDSDDTSTDTDHEASLATGPETSGDPDQSAEPEKSVESQQMDSADPSHGLPALAVIPYRPSARKVLEPQPQVSGTEESLWSILVAVLTVGSIVFLAHALIDWSVKDWVLNPAPVDIAPLFKAETFVQANKTELPIPVPNAEFIPTGTLGSPCQAAPSPTPVDKSMMWRGIAMPTPMPTPMPAPTPTAMPDRVVESEPAGVPDDPIDVLKRLFDFDLPNPKPLLKWYFGLPTASQYTVIVIAMLVLECLAKPLIALVAHLVVLAIAYLASAAVLALLLIYGFTPERSLAIVLPADLALISSIWWAKSWLKNLASTSSSNSAGLAKLRNDVEDSRARHEQRLNGADRWITVIKDILKDMTKNWADSVALITGRLNKHGKNIETHQSLILALITDKASQMDLDEIDRIIDELSGKIDSLETSKGDADLLRTVQRKVDGLQRMAENIRSEHADTEKLEQVQEELKQMTRRVDELQNTEVDAEALEELAGKLDRHATMLADVLEAQDKRVADLESKMDGVKQELSSLTTTSDQHRESIERFEASGKKYTERLNQQASQVGRNKANIEKLEEEKKALKEENAKLREGMGILKSSVEVLEERMTAVETGQVKQEDLQKLRHNVTFDIDQKIDQEVNQLRSHTNSQHDVAMRDYKDLEARVGTRIDDSTKAVEEFCRSLLAEDMVVTDNKIEEHKDVVNGDINRLNDAVDDCFHHIDESIKASDKRASDELERLKATELQQVRSISQADVADEIRLKVEECMEKFMVSDKFRAAVSDAHQLTKKQSQRERLRAQVHELTEKLLGETGIQDKIYTNLMERQARDTNNPPGDPSEVIHGRRASSPGIGPSTSHPAPDDTIGNDDPAGDPPGVISGGQATFPDGMSSDNTPTPTPTTPEGPTIPDDVEASNGTRGVALGVPPGVNTGRRQLSLDGTTSASPSGDGDGTVPRPSGEGNDGTLEPKRNEVEEPVESDKSTDSQASGQTNSDKTDERLLGDFLGHMLARDGTEDKKNRHKTHAQKAITKQKRAQEAKEQDEATEKKEQEEDIEDDDDDAHDGADDDEPHDNDPRGPPPGSGGSHGHDGSGGNDDADQDGNDGGAPRPPRQTNGLANSIYAPSRLRNLNQQTRSSKYFKGLRVKEKENKAKEKNKESAGRVEPSQTQPMPQQNALSNQGQQGSGKTHRGKRGSGIVARELKREKRELEQQQQGGEGQNAPQA